MLGAFLLTLSPKVTTEIAKKHYYFLKSIGPRRLDMVRSTCDNVHLAVKRLPHPLEDVRQQRENFRQVRLMKYVRTGIALSASSDSPYRHDSSL